MQQLVAATIFFLLALYCNHLFQLLVQRRHSWKRKYLSQASSCLYGYRTNSIDVNSCNFFCLVMLFSESLLAGSSKSVFDVIYDVFYDTILPFSGCLFVSSFASAETCTIIEPSEGNANKTSWLEKSFAIGTFIPLILAVIFTIPY